MTILFILTGLFFACGVFCAVVDLVAPGILYAIIDGFLSNFKKVDFDNPDTTCDSTFIDDIADIVGDRPVDENGYWIRNKDAKGNEVRTTPRREKGTITKTWTNNGRALRPNKTSKMKSKLILLFLLSSFSLFGQYQVFVEVIDSTETAYDEYFTGKWTSEESNIFGMPTSNMVPEIAKDSVGIDTIQITRFFYYDIPAPLDNDGRILIWVKPKKIYLDMEFKKVIGKPKGSHYLDNH